jgi:hypothetical protein
VTELGPVWPPPLELGSVSQHSQHSRYSARGEGSGRGGTSHTSTRRSIDLPDVLAPIVDIYNDSEINVRAHTAMEKLMRIVTVGISGGRSLTRPFRNARRFPSPGVRATRTTLKFGICVPSFKVHFLSRHAKP